MSQTEPTQDPFLPPLLPTDNPVVAQKRQSARKTLTLWAVLIVMFVALYGFMSGGRPAHHAQEVCETNLWMTWGPIVLVFGLFALWLRRAYRAQRYTPEQEEAMLAHLDGNHVRARELWLAIAKQQSGNASFARISQLNAVSSAIALGDFDRARDELLAIEKSAGFLFTDGHRLLASASLARVFVLRGDLDRARAWVRSMRQRLERYRHERTGHGVNLRLTECFLLAREGKYEEALSLLQSRWRRQLLGHEPGATLLLRAYLVARTSAPRTSGASAPWVDALRTLGYDITFMWKEWPDLEAFAVESGLASRASSVASA